MKKSKHTESAMVKAVKQLESGVSADVVCREHGISPATLYNWKSKYSGMDVSQVKRPHEALGDRPQIEYKDYFYKNLEQSNSN